MRDSYDYSINENKTYKIIKETRNFAVQIDLESLKKRHVRQTRKAITAEIQQFIANNNSENNSVHLNESIEWQWFGIDK